jgi:hypothetical protein
MSQILGSIAMGLLLDRQSLGRRLRAFAGLGVLFAMVWIVHVWAYFYQRCALVLLASKPRIDSLQDIHKTEHSTEFSEDGYKRQSLSSPRLAFHLL